MLSPDQQLSELRRGSSEILLETDRETLEENCKRQKTRSLSLSKGLNDGRFDKLSDRRFDFTL